MQTGYEYHIEYMFLPLYYKFIFNRSVVYVCVERERGECLHETLLTLALNPSVHA